MKKFFYATMVMMIMVMTITSCSAPLYHQEIKVYNESGTLVNQFNTQPYAKINGSKKVNIANHCITNYDNQIQYPTSYTIISIEKMITSNEKMERLAHWSDKKFNPITVFYCGRTGNLHLDKKCEKLVKEMSGTSADLHICECTSKKEVQHLSQRHWECKECMKNKW